MVTPQTNMGWSLNICFLCLLRPLCLSTDQQDVSDRSTQKVMAVAGEDVILPCSLNPPMDAEDQTVEWTRRDLNPVQYVHIHQHGRDEHTMKDDNNQDRTTLFLNQLRTGNLSLKIFNVTISNEGLYRCFIPGKHESFVKLVVGQQDVSDTSTQKVMAVAGEDVILPCSLNPPMDAEDQTVEWTRRDLNPPYVHVHQHGRDEYTMKNELYQDKTAVFLHDLRTGNCSLRISKVRLSDQGLFKCFLPGKHESFVNLVVVAVSELNLSIVKISDSGLVLQCDSKGWYPEPELSWLDGQGNLLPAGSTDPVQGPDDGFYTVSSNITVEKASRFTCRVQLPNTNHSRAKDIPVPALQRTDVGCIISIGSNVILLGVIVILGLITGQPVEKLKAVCRSIYPGISSQPDYHSTPGSAVKRKTKQGGEDRDGDSADNQPLRQTV